MVEKRLRPQYSQYSAVRFANSTYASYAWYTLGRAHHSDRNHGKAGLAYEKALKWKGFPLRDELLYNLSTVHLKQANVAKAKEYLAILKTEYPASKLAASIDRQISTAEKEK
ncbi:MAG: hypothetical protein Q7T82_03750 [Armatimonadota bacterium]|nr:hypothetical protein [Armatimonadota bacterium]